jgi:pilus assembly protein CpaB
MRRLTPAGVSTMMVVVVGLLVTAYFTKLMRAEEPHSQATNQPQAVEFRSVPTAATVLEPGTVITAAHLGTSRLRTDAVGADTLLQEQNVIGRTVKQPIATGAVIRSSQLYQPGETPKVTRGMRAVAIAIPRDLALRTGMLKGGQYVDVYLTPRGVTGSDARLQGGMTLALLQGVRLLTVTPSESSTEGAGLVTLELTPEQATVLILAREKGDIALSYNPEGRGDGGVALKNRDRATFDEILGLPAGPRASAPGTFTAEVYKGSTRSIRQFDEPTKLDAPPPESTRVDPSKVVPFWARRAPARPFRTAPADRLATVPDRSAVAR